jgi:hypothetical protein
MTDYLTAVPRQYCERRWLTCALQYGDVGSAAIWMNLMARKASQSLPMAIQRLRIG